MTNLRNWALVLLSILVLTGVLVEQIAFADASSDQLTCINNDLDAFINCGVKCSNNNPCFANCVSAPTDTFASCTATALHKAEAAQTDFCDEARAMASQCQASYNNCSGMTGPELDACIDAYTTCESNSGISECQ